MQNDAKCARHNRQGQEQTQLQQATIRNKRTRDKLAPNRHQERCLGNSAVMGNAIASPGNPATKSSVIASPGNPAARSNLITSPGNPAARSSCIASPGNPATRSGSGQRLAMQENAIKQWVSIQAPMPAVKHEAKTAAEYTTMGFYTGPHASSAHCHPASDRFLYRPLWQQSTQHQR